MSAINDDLYKYKRQSLYKIAQTAGEDRKNTGYDYTNNIFRRTMSNHMFRNEVMINFLGFLNDIWVKMVDSIKSYRIFKNYTVDKDYKFIDK